MRTNAGMDKSAIEREARAKYQSWLFDEEDRIATERAQLTATGATLARPEVVTADSQALRDGEYSQVQHMFDHDKIRARQIREARQYGNLRPAQILDHEDGATPTNIYRDEKDLEAVVVGIFCWRCGDAASEDEHLQKERHRKLKNAQPHYEIPLGKTEMDCCGTCGAVLKLKQEVA